MKNEILAKVERLYELYHQGQIPTLTQHEVKPGLDPSSRLHYIYFTLPVCLNFQRSSHAMWSAALKTFQDQETNYLFYPEKTVETKYEKLQNDLNKHKLSLQRNKHTEIWLRLSQTLHRLFHDDPREIIAAGNNNVEQILKLIRVTNKEDFPYLKGPKLSNYWLYILDHYTDIRLVNKDKLSIIPDTHIIKSTIHLGLVGESPKISKVEYVWVELL